MLVISVSEGIIESSGDEQQYTVKIDILSPLSLPSVTQLTEAETLLLPSVFFSIFLPFFIYFFNITIQIIFCSCYALAGSTNPHDTVRRSLSSKTTMSRVLSELTIVL